MTQVHKRVVLHFPGFEPLDAAAHRARYGRSARQSSAVWGYTADVGDLQSLGTAPFFDVRGRGVTWATESRVHIVDHNDLVAMLNGRSLPTRLASGYLAALRVAVGGGMMGYFRHAWRFGLFFIVPFLLVFAGALLSLLIALAPHDAGLSVWSLVASVPLAVLFFLFVFLPLAERLHTLHLFSDWEMAVAMAGLNGLNATAWIDRCAASVRAALNEPADEYLISSHSMGSSVAAHVIGLLLEREPGLFDGKRVVFATLGSAILQCAFLRSAKVLRSRVGLIADCPQIAWIDVQCLTDAIHFYKAEVVALCGHLASPQATIMRIRFKTMLSDVHYKKIRGDFLRVHRQYVLGPDLKSTFDFTLMTAGPLPASDFPHFTPKKLPVL
ncbi:MAG: hypothetical protein ABWY49_06140 [Rhizobium sp.]